MMATALLAVSIICSIMTYQPIIEGILGTSLLDLFREYIGMTQFTNPEYKQYDTHEAYHSVQAYPNRAFEGLLPSITTWHLYAIIALLAAALIMTLGTRNGPLHFGLHYHRP